MNSVKYNNWREAVQNHRHAASGFDKEAAWQKLNPPQATGRKRILYWLAAACLLTALFVAALQWSKKTDDATPGMVKKQGGDIQVNPLPNEVRPEQALVPNKNLSDVSEKAVVNPLVNDLQPGKNTLVKTPEHLPPPTPEPMNRLPEQTAFAAIDTPAATVTIPAVVATKNNTAANVLKIVHINELNNQNAGISQMVQEERKPSRIPFSKPAYTQYAADQEPPPVQTERRRFGLLKTVASLKEN